MNKISYNHPQVDRILDFQYFTIKFPRYIATYREQSDRQGHSENLVSRPFRALEKNDGPLGG